MVTEAQILTKVDREITRHKTTEIYYYPYVSGATDIYKQRAKSFGTAVSLTGRAILEPTQETLTVIGDGEEYDIAFLFSRLEMLRKFPTAEEGEWMSAYGQIAWWRRRYKIEKAAPLGQAGIYFAMMVILAKNIQGERNP